MKTRYILAAAAIAAAAVSCQQKEEGVNASDIVTFHVLSEDAGTKTVLHESGAVWWGAGDRIKVFAGSAEGIFTADISEASPKADFNGPAEGFGLEEGKVFRAIYPAKDDNSFDGEAFTLTLPEVQTGLEGSFGKELFVSLAQSESHSLSFLNLCGGVKFTVDHEGLKYVTFKGNGGENLAGRVKAGFDGNGKPEVKEVLDAQAEIRLDAPEGGFIPGEWYYIVTFRATLANGYTLTFFRDEPIGNLSSDSSVSIKRSIWGALTLADGDIVEDIDPEAVDMGLSVQWASFNLGTDSPAKRGDAYAWGEIETKERYGWDNYKWAEGGSNNLTKYVTAEGFGLEGFLDGKNLLDPEDDAATAALGDLWRTPTADEWAELADPENCTWTRTTRKGADGYEVVSKITGKSIFLPATASGQYDGYYWSSAIDTEEPNRAIAAAFSPDAFSSSYTVARSSACAVRPVYGHTFRLIPSSVELIGLKDNFRVEVVSTMGYEISSKPTWITPVSTEEVAPNHFVHTLQVSANTSSRARTGVVVFCNDNNQCVPMTVTQGAKTTESLEVSTTGLSFGIEGGETSFDIESNIEWTVSSDASWISVTPSSGKGNATVKVTVGESTSEDDQYAVISVVPAEAKFKNLSKSIPTFQCGTISADFDWDQTFSHTSLMMRFTATWCGYCPYMGEAVAIALENNPGKLLNMNLHPSSSDLAFVGTSKLENIYKIGGAYPSGIVDGRREVQNYTNTSYTANFITTYVDETENSYTVSTAIIGETAFNGSTLNTDLTVYFREKGEYKLTVVLLEDGIIGNQTDYKMGVTHTDYVHNDIARVAVTDIRGNDVSIPYDGSSSRFHFSTYVPTQCVKDNLRVLVYVQRAFGDQKVVGKNYNGYYVDNCTSAKAGEAIPLTVVK